MANQTIYETDFGNISRKGLGMVNVSFKESTFDIALGGLTLFNNQLKRSPFVPVGYNPVPSYVVMGVKTTNTKLHLKEEDYLELRALVQGAISIIAMEDDIKSLL